MRPTLLAVVAAALLVACGRGAASPLRADQAPAFNDADVSFMQAMIPHHQQAIEMAKLVTGRTRRPQVVKFAAAITANQAAEIGNLHAWLTRWRRPAAAEGGTHHDLSLLPGMLAEGQLEWLQTLTGTQFDLGFLSMMRTHHSGAVELAETELRSGASAEVKALARQIMAVQQSEIRQLQRWKDTWTSARRVTAESGNRAASSCCRQQAPVLEAA